MIPTLFGIMLINFIIIQAAPGGPIQQIVAKLRGQSSDLDSRLGGAGQDIGTQSIHGDSFQEHTYRGAQGIDPALIKELEIQFGFDKPAHERFFKMIGNYLTFDFGKSYLLCYGEIFLTLPTY